MSFIQTLQLPDPLFAEDTGFCQLFPLSIQQHDRLHWSPLTVIYKATQFLSNKKNTKILDIGSGAGKFCLAGAYYKPTAFFYGVEQRKYLVEQAQSVQTKSGRLNIKFMHKNFTQLDLMEFDNFYFYNSFFENLRESDKIDDNIAYSPDLYQYYSRYLYGQLDEMPSGTRIATYCSWDDEIPPGYRLVETYFEGLLKLWSKL